MQRLCQRHRLSRHVKVEAADNETKASPGCCKTKKLGVRKQMSQNSEKP